MAQGWARVDLPHSGHFLMSRRLHWERALHDTAIQLAAGEYGLSDIVTIGDATLYHGDCLEILPTLPKVDAVITDPPYGIDFKYESHDDDPDAYPALMQTVVPLCDMLCRDGWLFFWQGMLNADRWHKWFPAGFRLFASCKDFTQYRPTEIQYGFDPVICWRNGKGSKGQAGIRDWHVAATSRHISGPKYGHPCPRPIDAVEHVVGIGSKDDDVVLDPFMGSGTTGVACANLGRKFIGIEIERKYFDIACERIDNAYRQARMFA